MRKSTAVLGSALFFLIVPCTTVVLIPWWITGLRVLPPFFGIEAVRGLGAALVLAGVPGLLDSFGRFALQGLGTPAPVAPPARLVVTGLYARVRNPMYVSVVAIVLGESLAMGDWRLSAYAVLFWLATHLYVVFHEEPVLKRTFGEAYGEYCAQVPRWLPRLAPWCGRH